MARPAAGVDPGLEVAGKKRVVDLWPSIFPRFFIRFHVGPLWFQPPASNWNKYGHEVERNFLPTTHKALFLVWKALCNGSQSILFCFRFIETNAANGVSFKGRCCVPTRRMLADSRLRRVTWAKRGGRSLRKRRPAKCLRCQGRSTTTTSSPS